jgi:AAA domain/RNase_H superfamily
VFQFRDWWAHDRQQEKLAFEQFIDWVFDRWKRNPGMHIYHYAAYECCAVRRLSTRHDTRQDEVDDLLRNNVFVDLYQIVRHALRIGEKDYSIKTIEILYRFKRAIDLKTASGSIVQYASWMATGEPPNWTSSPILKGIRDYNQDDCRSNAELTEWLRNLAKEKGIAFAAREPDADTEEPKSADPEIAKRQELATKLRAQGDAVSVVLGDLVDYHRREAKPTWWRMFDRAEAADDVLRDDPACIEGITANGPWLTEQRSLVQRYRFDPSQECKIDAGDTVMFTHNLAASFRIAAIDPDNGDLTLKIGKKSLDERCEGKFPEHGSILTNEFVAPGTIPEALFEVASQQLSNTLHPPVRSLLQRSAPAHLLQKQDESPLDSSLRIIKAMSGGCLVIQGPPGTGKTYTASCMIDRLLAAGKKIGVTSNSHKAVVNLLSACGEAARRNGRKLVGIKVGDEPDADLHAANPRLAHVEDNSKARANYAGGIVGGTAWLFTRPEWKDELDFLFVDEAGQVPLANVVAMSRSANNLVLLGDQMQLEQPVQGSHPGDAGLSALQYALKDTTESKPDAPVFHAVIPADLGLFLGESRRMHPDVCRFISESIYESRLGSLPECAKQKIAVPRRRGLLVTRESGIVFIGVEHDGNIQQSDEEVERVKAIYAEMVCRGYTTKDGITKPLELDDFLFIAPYNAQVRALKTALPSGARVGSVDKFQGQEAAVCILSMCSSYGEYGSRGLKFILNRARINVAISRAKCLALVVGDPRIAKSAADSINQMKLLNVFCKLIRT